MSDQIEKKKISLQDAIKQQLANKKAGQENSNSKGGSWSTKTNPLRSQQTKKINNQRKRQGT